MKFPYELSEDRQSLLSEKDRMIYEYEHSPFYSVTDKEESIKLYNEGYINRYNYNYNIINEDEEYKQLNDVEKGELCTKITQLEALEMFDDLMVLLNDSLLESLTNEQIDDIKKYTVELITNTDINAINEAGGTAPGHDMTYWIPDMGWLGKMAMGILGTGIAGMGWLIMQGWDKRAAKQLEVHMNKLVELTDDGINKKQSFFSRFGQKIKNFFGEKNRADQSDSCFRYAQEMVERELAKNVLIAGKSCGLLTGNGMDDAIQLNYLNGGLLNIDSNSFYANIVEPVSCLVTENL